jgi:hypothetical protein
LIGPGDSVKSTVLDAIDLCLSARRSAPFGDTAFYLLDVSKPIAITLTLGLLPDALKSVESYAEFLRGHDASTASFEDEPRASIETVISLRLTVASDLEPVWSPYSDRAAAAGIERSLRGLNARICAWQFPVLLDSPCPSSNWCRMSCDVSFGIVNPTLKRCTGPSAGAPS